jgi:hypothetical protein
MSPLHGHWVVFIVYDITQNDTMSHVPFITQYLARTIKKEWHKGGLLNIPSL